jgi:hypothetical protein
MRARCYHPSDVNYIRYSAKGITVCDRWRYDYDAFVEDMGFCPEGLTLDRIDNDGNYEPGNCRWATYRVQLNNRGDFNRIVELNGVSQTLGQWATQLGHSLELIHWRLKNMSVERALQVGSFYNKVTHGTNTMYVYGCRCLKCKVAHSVKNKVYYQNKKARAQEAREVV